MSSLVVLLAVGVLATAVSMAAPSIATAQSSSPRVSDPSNLAARSGAAPGTVDLSWTPSAGAQYHFVAYIPSGVADLNTANILPVPAVGSATVDGLTPGTEYRFVVIGGRWDWTPVFGPQWSSWSNVTSATATPGATDVTPTAPGGSGPVGTPGDLVATPGNTSGTVALSWTPGTNAQYHFIAYIPSGVTDLNSAQILPVGPVGGALAGGLMPATDYRFVVTAGRWEWTPDFGPKWSPSWSSVVTATAAGMPFVGTAETDKDALEALYNATEGPNWTERSGWLTDAPMGEWHGVTTDESGRVIELRLNGNNLSGEIPATVGNLTELTRLELYRNGLTGSIPAELVQLGNLEEMNLFGNQLSGTAPGELGNMTNLKTLFLQDNRLTGTVPPSLGNLSNLERLSLRANQMSGELPASLGNLSNLELMNLGGNGFSGEIPESLGNLSNLDLLYLFDNELTGPIPDSLGRLTNLTKLSLRDNMLTDDVPASLGNLTNLTLIRLGGNSLTGCVPDTLQDVENNDYAILGLPFCGAAPAGSVATDREALIAFYSSTNGADWNNNQNWQSQQPLSEWHGVWTDDSGRVTSLNMPNNGITGSLPSKLGDLSEMEWLSFFENQLTGSIPPELSRLSNMTRLHLDKNQLTGTIPSELGGLSNLTLLTANQNRLSGSIPSELGNLTDLELLALGGNQLTGSIPSQLGNLTNLTELYLWGNQLTGDIPSSFGNLTNLTSLFLSGNDLTGCIPASLRDVTDNDLEDLGLPFCGAAPGATASDQDALVVLYNATGGPNWTNRDGWLSDAPIGQWHGVTTNGDGRVIRIDLGRNELNGQLPDAIGNLAELTYLALWGNDLSGPIPDSFARLSRLQGLDVGGNQLTGSLPSWLGDFTSLTYLSLWGNNFESSIPTNLGNLTNLRTLDIRENQLNEHIPPELGNLASLEILWLYRNSLSGSIPPTFGNLSSLIELRLSQNELSGPIPSEFGNLSNLTRLSLADNQLTGEIPASLGNLHNLERLQLSGNDLTGCFPFALYSVLDNDLLGLVLHTCETPAPGDNGDGQFPDPDVSYLKWEVGPGVPREHYALVREGILYLHRYATPLGLPELPDDATVYLYRDRELMAQTLARLERRPLQSARESVNSGSWGGLAGLEDEDSGWLMINLHTTSRHGSLALVGVAAHELSHVYQYTLQSHGRFDNTHSEVRVIGPAWMQEGVADFHRWAALAEADAWAYEERRDQVINLARRVDVTLKETETYDGLLAGSGRFDLAALAAELLAAESSEAALIEFWTLLEPGATWQEAFETAFGMTVDEFYPLFERHWANGFPTLDLG